MIRTRDALGRDIFLQAPPRRIVSLVPSDTWSVVRLGAGDRLVGRTDYCVEPPGLPASSVGGTKNPRLDDLLALGPDLVLANQEENRREDVEALTAQGVVVYVSFPRRVAEGIAHLAMLARLLGLEQDEGARGLIRQGYRLVQQAEQERSAKKPLRAFCPIWMDPLMTIHGDTYISDMMALIGAENVFGDRPRRYPLAADLGRVAALSGERVAGRDTRYPRVTLDEVVERAPEIVLLPDEPHPFSEQDAEVFRALPIPAARSGAILRCSGKDLCWYGAQAIDGYDRMKNFMETLRARVAATNSPSA